MKIPNFVGKTAVAKPKAKSKATTPQHNKFNLELVTAKYNQEENEFYCVVNDEVIPLVWDASHVRFPNLFSLPSNDAHKPWTCVQFDIKQYDEEKLTKVLEHWSPVKADDKVYVVLHEGNAIITSKKG